MLLEYALTPSVNLLVTAVVGAASAPAIAGALLSLYHVLWLFPAYVTSLLVNCIWCVAALRFECSRGWMCVCVFSSVVTVVRVSIHVQCGGLYVEESGCELFLCCPPPFCLPAGTMRLRSWWWRRHSGGRCSSGQSSRVCR